MRQWLLRAVLLTVVFWGGAAAPALSQAPLAVEGLNFEVWTMGPGTEVWERFGHNAIVVSDPRVGGGRLYNWGMFSFQQENFFLNFAKGRMQYWMASGDADAILRAYAAAGRTVWRQTLRLTPAEKASLLDRLERNDTDAERFYRYDYYRDNCSTRVRDAIDQTLGGQLHAALDTVATGTTYRSHTRDLVRPDLPLYTGLQLLLGPRTDQPISAWEEAFLPMELMAELDRATRLMPDGQRLPVIERPREVLFAGALPTELPQAPSALLPLGALGLLLAVGVATSARGEGLRVWPAIFWASISGAAGLILWAAWFLTDHLVARGNANLLLAVIAALPLTWMVRKPGNVAVGLAWLVAGSTLAACILEVLPGGQPLADTIVLLAPANLALAWVVHTRARRYP